MHLFPYIDSLWFGEGFDLEQRGMGPDYWLVEMSGVPFGLPSELMAPGNPWRGMLHGSAVRMLAPRRKRPCHEQYWRGNPLCTKAQRRPPAPRPHASTLWGLWRSFGIESTVMHGYWDSDPPVTVRAASAMRPVLAPPTGCDDVYVTSYVRPRGGGTLLVLASWAAVACNCSLQIAWVRRAEPLPDGLEAATLALQRMMPCNMLPLHKPRRGCGPLCLGIPHDYTYQARLGLSAEHATISAPALPDMQPGLPHIPAAAPTVQVAPGRGWFLEIRGGR